MNNGTPTIVIVLGTRPEVIRFSPIIKELSRQDVVKLKLIHTGQHYSKEMSQVFFDELGLSDPDFNLQVGSMDPARQLGEIIIRLADIFDQLKPDLVCVWGDTTSSLGAALAANKKGIRVAHIESGCRSFDYRMAEEYNRILIDHISELLYPLSNYDLENLNRENVPGKIYSFGDPLQDVFLSNMQTLQKQDLRSKFNIDGSYAIVTLHRAENVDNNSILTNILNALAKIKDYKLIWPIHPRTLKMVKTYELEHMLKADNLIIVDPLSYHEILELLQDAEFVLTDSGGFQKEAFFAKKPLITFRKSTEWYDTVRIGTNVLADPEADIDIDSFIMSLDALKLKYLNLQENPYGTGDSALKISASLLNEVSPSSYAA